MSPAIRLMNLSYVKARLVQKLGWNEPRADAAIQGYKEYLQQCLRAPEGRHQPTKDADEAWHAHILHTRAYAQDCRIIFGHFLHHVPSGTTCDAGSPAEAATCFSDAFEPSTCFSDLREPAFPEVSPIEHLMV